MKMFLQMLFLLLPSLSTTSPLYQRCSPLHSDQNFCRLPGANTVEIITKRKSSVECSNYCEFLNSQHPSYTGHLLHNYTDYYPSILKDKTNFKLIESQEGEFKLSYNYLHASFSNIPLVDIAEIMSAYKTCHGFNFFSDSGVCQLFPYSPEPTFRTDNKLCIYYQKSAFGSCPLKTYEDDCHNVVAADGSDNGIYWISINNLFHPIYCVFSGGQKYTVFQRRVDGSVNFGVDWDHYKEGFGDLRGSFWLGNELLHKLTHTRPYTMSIYMETFDAESAQQDYINFQLKSEAFEYAAVYTSNNGTANDGLYGNTAFSTFDEDNDVLAAENCASKYSCGWWFKQCHIGILNGLYMTPDTQIPAYSINWPPYKGFGVPMRYSLMMLRRM